MTSINVNQVKTLHFAILQSFLKANENRLIDNRTVRHLPESYVARRLFHYILSAPRLLLIACILLLHGFHTLRVHVVPVDFGGLGPALLRVQLYHAEAQELREYQA